MAIKSLTITSSFNNNPDHGAEARHTPASLKHNPEILVSLFDRAVGGFSLSKGGWGKTTDRMVRIEMENWRENQILFI